MAQYFHSFIRISTSKQIVNKSVHHTNVYLIWESNPRYFFAFDANKKSESNIAIAFTATELV